MPNPFETIDIMRELQGNYLEGEKQENWEKLEAFYQTSEYKALPYHIRNRGFITAHKLMDYMKCPWCYAQKYVNEIPDPTETDEEKDALIIGQALDDLATEGHSYFSTKYEVVARRSKDAEKVQLTQLQGRIVNQLMDEFRNQKIFNQQPKKKIILYKTRGGLILKAELDDIDMSRELILDIKSCADILSFDPAYYLIQAAFYNLLVELKFEKNFQVMLEVVDKFRYFSRSGAWIYKLSTLQPQKGRILDTLTRLQSDHDTGIFPIATDQETLYRCPYYPYKGHGRPTEPKFY